MVDKIWYNMEELIGGSEERPYQCVLQGHAHISGGVRLQINHRSFTHG